MPLLFKESTIIGFQYKYVLLIQGMLHSVEVCTICTAKWEAKHTTHAVTVGSIVHKLTTLYK